MMIFSFPGSNLIVNIKYEDEMSFKLVDYSTFVKF